MPDHLKCWIQDGQRSLQHIQTGNIPVYPGTVPCVIGPHMTHKQSKGWQVHSAVFRVGGKTYFLFHQTHCNLRWYHKLNDNSSEDYFVKSNSKMNEFTFFLSEKVISLVINLHSFFLMLVEALNTLANNVIFLVIPGLWQCWPLYLRCLHACLSMKNNRSIPPSFCFGWELYKFLPTCCHEQIE